MDHCWGHDQLEPKKESGRSIPIYAISWCPPTPKGFSFDNHNICLKICLITVPEWIIHDAIQMVRFVVVGHWTCDLSFKLHRERTHHFTQSSQWRHGLANKRSIFGFLLSSARVRSRIVPSFNLFACLFWEDPPMVISKFSRTPSNSD